MEGSEILNIAKDFFLGLKGIKSQNSQGIVGVEGNQRPRFPKILWDGKQENPQIPEDSLGWKGVTVKNSSGTQDSQGFPGI